MALAAIRTKSSREIKKSEPFQINYKNHKMGFQKTADSKKRVVKKIQDKVLKI